MTPKNKSFISKPEDFSIKVSEKLSPRWREFTQRINERVFGQERAIRKIVRNLIVLESGVNDFESPPPVLLFTGPSGSGKTHLVKIVAEEWLGKPTESGISPLVKISGENYSQKHEGATLKGAPPGYIGHGEELEIEKIGEFNEYKVAEIFNRAVSDWYEKYESQLTEEIAEYMRDCFLKVYEEFMERFIPFRSVFLVDEFEKMHPDVQKQFLGILDDGKLQMHNGRTIDFRGTLIIFTSNIGTDKIAKIQDNRELGFHPPRQQTDLKQINQDIYKQVLKEVRKSLDPALYSRIGHDGVVVFEALSSKQYKRIIRKEIQNLQSRLSGIEGNNIALLLHTTPEFNNFILGEADVDREGARQIKRLIFKHMKVRLASGIDAGDIRNRDEVLFDVEKIEKDTYKVILHRLSRRRRNKIGNLNIIKSDKYSIARVEDEDENELVKELYEKFNNHFRKVLKAITHRQNHPIPKQPEEPSSSKDDD